MEPTDDTPASPSDASRLAVLVWHPAAAEYASALRQRLPATPVRTRLPDDPVEPLRGIRVLLGWELPPAAFAALPDLEWMQATGAGVDHLLERSDLPEDLVLTRSLGRFGTQTAEYVVGWLLALLIGVGGYREDQRARRWRPRPRPLLADLTVGVLGLGEIGRAIAGALAAFDASVLGARRSPGAMEGVARVYTGDAWRDMLPRCDALVVAVPLTPATRRWIGVRELEALPQGAILINVARGEIVDEGAVLATLDSGHLGAAVLDVFSTEPLPRDDPLWRHERVHVTPHVAAPSEVGAIADEFADNYRLWTEGRELRNLVDLERGY